MIEYKNVVLRYTDTDILKDVNLRIEDGEFMVLVGPSGSGKNHHAQDDQSSFGADRWQYLYGRKTHQGL
mgnify:CR=1 FL=1